MTEILDGLGGMKIIIDDFLIYGRTQSEHEERLERVLNRIRDAGIKLNRDKCEFSEDRIEYFGHIICKEGFLPSPIFQTFGQEMKPIVFALRTLTDVEMKYAKIERNVKLQFGRAKSLIAILPVRSHFV